MPRYGVKECRLPIKWVVCKLKVLSRLGRDFFIYIKGGESMTEYDIAVIGAGPAGASFARLVSKRFKTAVIDKTHTLSGRAKPCGGLLSPDAQNCLARYSLTLPKDILVTPQIFAVKTMDFASGTIRRYQRSYLNMDRAKFDDWLRSLIPPDVSLINARVTSVYRTKSGFVTEYKENGEIKSIKSKYVIGADGAKSIVRRAFFPDRKIRKYIAVQKWFEADKTAPFYSCVFDRYTSDCCSWSISKDEYMLYGGAFAFKDSKEMFSRQLEAAKKNGFTFGREVLTEACTVCRPKSVGEIISGKDDVLLLGEAGGFISPSSLEGISWAIRCAECAAKAFECENPAKEYSRLTKRLKIKLFLKILKCPFMYNPTLRRMVMSTGINSLKVNED